MSRYCDEKYEVYREQPRRAAKEHICSACGETILKGHMYCSVGWVFDGSAGGVKRCLRCQKIHEHLRGLGDHDMWPDEKLNCGEEYTQHWGVEPPPDIEALAFVTGAELQNQEKKP